MPKCLCLGIVSYEAHSLQTMGSSHDRIKTGENKQKNKKRKDETYDKRNCHYILPKQL